MPDIAMCPGGECEIKLMCYRYTASPSMYSQSYIEPEFKDGKCPFFWDNTGFLNEAEKTQ